MEERSLSLEQGERQFYNNLATVLQGKRLMRRETNGRKKFIFTARGKTIL